MLSREFIDRESWGQIQRITHLRKGQVIAAYLDSGLIVLFSKAIAAKHNPQVGQHVIGIGRVQINRYFGPYIVMEKSMRVIPDECVEV